ncbi:DUF4411 family protein [Christensenella timonensis]|uniref:DUF4411 family protein n=1 Tax=Christensenella timonensis TaxID=1816678 RepID=UPI00082C37E7|nr:DUF4411 family protein [Christensenella timonensis]
MDKTEIFLLDANVFITPHQQYYRFTFAPSFWNQLNERAQDGRIVSISLARNEICRTNEEDKKDVLQKWIEDTYDGEFIDVFGDADIVNCYGEVINHIQESPQYSDAAFNLWANNQTADPWIIATAKAHSCYTVVTCEKGGKRRNNPKIPDVCDAFSVPYVGIFEMVEDLGIRL